ncbi:MAG: hypothetical protein ACK5B9_05645 [Flavobacteriia bacterium]
MILLYGFFLALFLGIINGYYWSKQGYRGYTIYVMGTIGFFGLISMVLKFIKS